MIHDDEILTKEQLEKLKNRCLDLKEIIIENIKKKQYLQLKKNSEELIRIINYLKKQEKKLKKEGL